jgi:hypothetical protein
MPEAETLTAQAWYEKQQGNRNPYLERAREASKLTIPTLVTEEGDKSAQKLKTPYQSVGARGVNNLSSALLMSLLPPNAPFFRLALDEKAKAEMEGIEQVKTEVSTALSEMERNIHKEIEGNNFRVGLFGALKQLIVSGNVLLHIPKEGHMRVFHLDRFCITRDPMGNVERIVIKEDIAKEQVPEEINTSDTPSDVDTVSLYTSISTIDSKTVEVYQEIGGIRVGGSEGTFPKDKNPFLPLRLNRVDGEDYGRGYVEEYLGDLESLEGLTQAIVEGSAASAKLLFLVAPNGTTRKSRIASAANGAIIDGSAGDVSVLQTQKHADFRVAFETINQIQERLNYAFMLTEAAIRKAERVTAEEVRLVTQAIERQLGGIYSVLSQEFQLPLVKIVMQRMQSSGRLPKMPKNMIHPMVVTGIEALGRGNDLNKLDSFVAGIGQILGPEAVQQFVNMSEYLDRRAAALGIDTKGLIKSQEELQQEAQQAQQQAMMQQLGPKAMDAVTNSAQLQQQQQNQAPPQEG